MSKNLGHGAYIIDFRGLELDTLLAELSDILGSGAVISEHERAAAMA